MPRLNILICVFFWNKPNISSNCPMNNGEPTFLTTLQKARLYKKKTSKLDLDVLCSYGGLACVYSPRWWVNPLRLKVTVFICLFRWGLFGIFSTVCVCGHLFLPSLSLAVTKVSTGAKCEWRANHVAEQNCLLCWVGGCVCAGGGWTSVQNLLVCLSPHLQILLLWTDATGMQYKLPLSLPSLSPPAFH